MYVDVVESFLAAARPVNELYKILVSTIRVKRRKGNSPIMAKYVGSSESGNKDGVEGVVNDERDTATTTRINRKSAITTKGMVIRETTYEKSVTISLK
ncbi:hypothetical protein PRIPAC_98062 [Pristionchus pacificus]|uniref:Uncharacterized protein n=3 Tax=Pristionchus pacificus TaxID=54126 RepID=A0A2A6CUE2_PRIPA|nr:hypothetical protein PRIPAC_98062 [Pristionchus pacificus]|eukprot:PDM81842.1 hypothetical protein PRIPAC_33996 [Pristionchus pacificus]